MILFEYILSFYIEQLEKPVHCTQNCEERVKSLEINAQILLAKFNSYSFDSRELADIGLVNLVNKFNFLVLSKKCTETLLNLFVKLHDHLEESDENATFDLLIGDFNFSILLPDASNKQDRYSDYQKYCCKWMVQAMKLDPYGTLQLLGSYDDETSLKKTQVHDNRKIQKC
jgi:hypothetical protein